MYIDITSLKDAVATGKKLPPVTENNYIDPAMSFLALSTPTGNQITPLYISHYMQETML